MSTRPAITPDFAVASPFDRSNGLFDASSPLILMVPLDVDEAEWRSAESVLCEEERQRAARYVHLDLGRRFAVCRGRLRIVLGALLGVSPASIEFAYGGWGKPYLPSQPSLHFNLTHSQEIALMAFSRTGPIGIDIEYFDRRMNDEAIASQLFGDDEFDEWDALVPSAKRANLLKTWVGKEAVLKALGLGITESLKKIRLPLSKTATSVEAKLDAALLDKAALANPNAPPGFEDQSGVYVSFVESVPQAIGAVCSAEANHSLAIHAWDTYWQER